MFILTAVELIHSKQVPSGSDLLFLIMFVVKKLERHDRFAIRVDELA